MPIQNQTKYAVLGLLSHEPMTGYDIKKRIETSLSYFWDAGYGQIYPTLHHLEEEGLVAKKTETDGKRPARKVFSLTPSGREALVKWLREPAKEEKVRFEILLKMFFGAQITLEENLSNIRAFRERHLHNLNILQMFEANLRENLSGKRDHLYYLATVLFGKKAYQAYIEWTDEISELLKQQEEYESN